MSTSLVLSNWPTPDLVLSELIAIFPDFEAEWNADENYFVGASGNFTYHGLFMEFSPYFVAHFHEFSPEKIQALCDYIEQFVRDDDIHESIDNAICTCFLEDVGVNPSFDMRNSYNPIDKHRLLQQNKVYTELTKHLKPKSLKFYLDFHNV